MLCSWSLREPRLLQRYLWGTRFLVPALLMALSLQVSATSLHQNRLASGKPLTPHSLSCYSPPSVNTLVVGDSRDFDVSVTLRNDGEDSYGTKVTCYYPSGLSYRKVSASQVAKSSSVSWVCLPPSPWLAVLHLSALVPEPVLQEALACDS